MNKQQIKELMRANQTTQAHQQLKHYLKENPQDAEGWYLASFLSPTPSARFEAIQRAAKLDSSQADIQKRLEKLNVPNVPRKRGYWLPLFIIGALVVVIVLVFAFAAGGNRPASEISDLPTLASLPTLIDTPVPPSVLPDTPTEDIPAPTVVLPAVQPSEAPFNTQAPVVNNIPTALPADPNQMANLPTPTTFILQPANPLPLPTSMDSVTDVAPTTTSSAPTSIPTQAATIPPTAVAPSATPAFSEVTPLNSPITIAAGQFRVVNVTRGAESVIQDLGGTFPPAPAGQSWVLLELLLLCSDGAACTFSPSVLTVTGSTGSVYPYSVQLNLLPQFGSSIQNNQIWGYLGFTLPTSETQLKLLLTEKSRTYALALE